MLRFLLCISTSSIYEQTLFAGCLDSFHFMFIVNNAAMNIHVTMYIGVYSSVLKYILKHEASESLEKGHANLFSTKAGQLLPIIQILISINANCTSGVLPQTLETGPHYSPHDGLKLVNDLCLLKTKALGD